MADYKKMYSALFNAITDTISILQKVQKETEELYISSDEPAITLLEDFITDDIENHRLDI